MAKVEGGGQEGPPSRIPVSYLILGYENNRNTIINFCRNATSMINCVTDAIHPTLGSHIDWFWKGVSDARIRGVKCKQITDITSDNLPGCKKVMARIDELRHLDGIMESCGVTDTEAVAMVPPFAARESQHNNIIQFIHSDSESVVRLKQLLFDLLWTRATPAQSRIDELEGREKKDSSAVGGGGRSTETAEAKKNVIDRIYVCNDCHDVFVYWQEVEDHMKTQGHGNFREYPLV
jgi:hypothetical protein